MASVKDEVRALLDSLPGDVTLEDVEYQLYVRRKVQEGLRAAEEGRTVTQEEAKARMARWLDT